jgi:glycosyltransferase involved in cell wall biosynthesis
MIPRFSIIVPVYNRPQELEELLISLTQQTFRNFEVVIVEDGSTHRSDDVVGKFSDQLKIHYFFKPNSGPGPSRNAGFHNAKGEYFVVFDSDCLIPPHYLDVVDKSIQQHGWDAWGGPDRAHESFTRLQRAMGYTMSSVLTTGGIRGGKKHLGWFQPRSFNMGLSRHVFEVTQGFHFDRFAEDIEFSIRMRNHGFRVGLIPEAFVFHKRRTNFSQFFQQVKNFGKGRALIGQKYPSEVKITHWVPALFVIGIFALVLLALVSLILFYTGAALLIFYFVAIFIHSLIANRDLRVALLSVPSALLQLWGYGVGFLRQRIVLLKSSKRNVR